MVILPLIYLLKTVNEVSEKGRLREELAKNPDFSLDPTDPEKEEDFLKWTDENFPVINAVSEEGLKISWILFAVCTILAGLLNASNERLFNILNSN